MAVYGKSADLSRTTSVGSKATSSASNKATNVAMGNNGGVVSSSAPRRGQRPLGSVKRSVHPGSSAGLNNHKTVHLAQNNSGYLNKSNQLARYKVKQPMPRPAVGMDQMKPKSGAKLFDNRFCSGTSSVSKLNRIMNV